VLCHTRLLWDEQCITCRRVRYDVLFSDSGACLSARGSFLMGKLRQECHTTGSSRTFPPSSYAHLAMPSCSLISLLHDSSISRSRQEICLLHLAKSVTTNARRGPTLSKIVNILTLRGILSIGEGLPAFSLCRFRSRFDQQTCKVQRSPWVLRF
jgi:hypothetical protein